MFKSFITLLLLSTYNFFPTMDWLDGGSEKPVYYEDKAIILMYHEVKNNNGRIAVSTEQLDQHLTILAEAGYNVISIEDFEDFVFGKKKKIPPNAVVLTFDDGYEDFYENAYPILRKHKMPATNFIIVKSSDIYDPNILPHLKWGQMKEMRNNGMSFYSHTYDHHRYEAINEQGEKAAMLKHPLYLPEEQRLETEEEYTQRITQDLAKAEELLMTKLGNTRNILSFPYGQYSDITLKVGKELGIKLYITIEEGINSRKPGPAPENYIAYRLNAGKADFSAEELLLAMQKYNDKQ